MSRVGHRWRACPTTSSCSRLHRTRRALGSGGRARWIANAIAPLAPDLRGHGAARRARPGRASRPAWPTSWPRRPSASCSCGYSMGGRIALHVALAHPSASSASCSSPATAGHRRRRRARGPPRRRRARWRPHRAAAGIEQFADALGRAAAVRRAAAAGRAAAAREDLLRNDPRALAAALRGLGTGVDGAAVGAPRRADDAGRRWSSASATRSSSRSASAWRRRSPTRELVVVPGPATACRARRPKRLPRRSPGDSVPAVQSS